MPSLVIFGLSFVLFHPIDALPWSCSWIPLWRCWHMGQGCYLWVPDSWSSPHWILHRIKPMLALDSVFLAPRKTFSCRFSGAFMKVVLSISEVNSLSLNYPQTLPSSLGDSFLVLPSTSPVLASTKSLLCMYSSCPIDPEELTAHEFLKKTYSSAWMRYFAVVNFSSHPILKIGNNIWTLSMLICLQLTLLE